MMQRFPVIEFEDLPWLPRWLRQNMTQYVRMIHRLLRTETILLAPIAQALRQGHTTEIVDLCSGSGGPLPEVVAMLRAKTGAAVHLTLTDLYPDARAAERINTTNRPWLRYEMTPLDATEVPFHKSGLRTMICCFHHMPPSKAQKILRRAYQDRKPICIFELSDNRHSRWLILALFPTLFMLTLLLTPFMRPLSWRQLIFTYFVPLLPFLDAWDGAASLARAYSPRDIAEMLRGLADQNYAWELHHPKRPLLKGSMLLLLGLPRSAEAGTFPASGSRQCLM
jgi:hypothetical protein